MPSSVFHPAGHVLHDVLFMVSEYFPLLHTWHCDCASKSLNVPVLHIVHTVLPSTEAYLPRPHLEQVLDFSVFVNTGQEFDGSDSGARPDEAVSWGKIRLEAKPVKVYCDATIAFPLIVCETFAKDFKSKE